MADSRVDMAKAFVNATIASRKETNRVDQLTSAIVSRYKQLPGVLNVIGGAVRSQAEKLTTINKLEKETAGILRDARIERQRIIGLMSIELAKVEKIREELASPNITNETKFALTKQLDDATIASRHFTTQLQGLNKEVQFLSTVGIPAAKSLDKLAAAQKSFADAKSLGGFRQLFTISGEINKSLINANSALTQRNRLLTAGLTVAAQTGVSMQVLSQAQEELVDLGFDLRDSYEETLRVTTQLIAGLGMSAKEAGSLAVIARTTNSQFKDLANVISSIVDTTSLAADEATRYARQLATAAKVASGPGGRFENRAFSQNFQALARVEDLMKGTIGTQGELASLLTKFTSYKELGGMGQAFGTGGTDFLARDEDGGRRTLANIAKMASNANGIMLETYADMLDTSKETLAALGQLYRDQGEAIFEISPEMKERQDFERRYREQMVQQNETFRMLTDKLIYLGARAITPLIGIVNNIASGLVWLIQKFENVKLVAIPVMTIVTAAVVSSTVKMSKALYQFVGAAVATSAALRAASATGGRPGIGGTAANVGMGAAAEGLGGMFTRLFKKGAVTAGAEAVGGTVVKGFLGRILGGIAGAFTGAAMRGLIGRGIALVGSAFLTGGWSLIIGLVVTLVAQFWPNLVSLFKGKGWSGDAGVKKQSGPSEFSQLIGARAEGLAMEVGFLNHEMMKTKLKMLEQDAHEMGATAAEVEKLRVEVAKAANREVVAFAGQAQRQQGVSSELDAKNLVTFAKMQRSLEQLNATLMNYSKDYSKADQEKQRREQLVQEEQKRKEAREAAQRAQMLEVMSLTM
jgi:hypothetical protein